MITNRQRNRLVRVVNRLLNAEEANSWKGAQRPEDIAAIEREVTKARAAFASYLDDITEMNPHMDSPR